MSKQSRQELMYIPPPPAPPVIVTENVCTADSKLCIYIPERVSDDRPLEYPTSLSDLTEGVPEEVGGFKDGEYVRGHRVPMWFLTLVYNFFPEEQQRDAILVASCESGFDTNARSNTGDFGLWQHNRRYIQNRWDRWRISEGLPTQRILPEEAFDPEVNAKLTLVLLELRNNKWSGSSGWACGRKVGAP